MSATAYNAFYDRLLPAYPISKGEMRIPIATTIETNNREMVATLTQELGSLLQTLLDTQASKDQAVNRATTMGEHKIVPLITDEYTGVVRFDCVLDQHSGQYKILEINCDYPDGLLLHDYTYAALSEAPQSIHHNLLDELFDDHEVVHVHHSDEAVFLDGYDAERRLFVRNPKRTVSFGPSIEKLESGTVRRCAEVTKLSPELCQLMAEKSLRYINTFALRTLGYKNLLETLEHPLIPTTIQLSALTLHTVEKEPERWVLKPADGCEGFGIYFGKDIATSDWQALIERLITQNYIAQEYVSLSTTPVSLYDEGTIVEKELYYDLCPHFFIKDGHVIGSGHNLMRYSTNPIVNVTQGGGLGYAQI